MKIDFIKRIMALSIIGISLLGFGFVGASAEWKSAGDGNWSYYNNGNQLKNTWFRDNSNGKWYYFNSDGIMAKNTTIGGYIIGTDGTWNQDNSPTTNTNSTSNSNLPVQIPSNWKYLGDNKYSINNRSVVTYSVSDMTGWTQESVMNDLRKITYQQGNYDSNVDMPIYNGNNAYAYSYTIVTKESMRKVLYIIIFKNNKHYDFILASEYSNYDADRKELENVLKTTLVLN